MHKNSFWCIFSGCHIFREMDSLLLCLTVDVSMSSIHHVETPQNLVDKGSNIRFAEGAMGRLRNLCDSFVSLHAAALAALIVLVFAMVPWCVGLFPGDIVIVVAVLWMSFTGCNSAVSSLCVPWRFMVRSNRFRGQKYGRSPKGMTMDEHHGKSESHNRNPNREPTCYLRAGFTFLLSPYLALQL